MVTCHWSRRVHANRELFGRSSNESIASSTSAGGTTARNARFSPTTSGQVVEAHPQDVEQRDRRELPDALPITRQPRRDGFHRLTRQREREPDGADGLAVLLVRTRDAGRRDADVRAEHPARTLGHLLGALLAHHA